MIKETAIRVLSSPPIWSVLKRQAVENRPLTVLCYHSLGPNRGGIDSWTVLRSGSFLAQLRMLRAHYEIVSLDVGLESDPGEGKPLVAITFDDGDEGLYTYLLPILRETRIPVTIFVATGQIESRKPYWFDRIINALQQPCEVRLSGVGRWTVPKATGKARWQVIGSILQALKDVAPEIRDDLADQVVEQGGLSPDPSLRPMTPEQLAELAAAFGVTIGAHSHGHELLDQIPLEQAKESIGRSRDLLRDWTGQEVSHFAFPNGNYNAALCATVKELGFVTACILENRLAQRGSDPFAVPRISIGRYDNVARLKLRLVGL